MPQTWQDAFYIIIAAVTSIAVCGVIPWLIKAGFAAMVKKMDGLEDSMNGLRLDQAKEREDRITHYGKLAADHAAHRAVCDERHKGH